MIIEIGKEQYREEIHKPEWGSWFVYHFWGPGIVNEWRLVNGKTGKGYGSFTDGESVDKVAKRLANEAANPS